MKYYLFIKKTDISKSNYQARIDALKNWCIDNIDDFQEKTCETLSDSYAIEKIIHAAEKDQSDIKSFVLVVESIKTLNKELDYARYLYDELCKQHINLISVDEPILNYNLRERIGFDTLDKNTLLDKIISLTVEEAFAERKRKISKRHNIYESAKNNGKVMKRPKRTDKVKENIDQIENAIVDKMTGVSNEKDADIAKRFNISKYTYYSIKQSDEVKQKLINLLFIQNNKV